MNEDEQMLAYANWGKFIELSTGLIPWDKLVDIEFSEPVPLQDGIFVKTVALAYVEENLDETEEE